MTNVRSCRIYQLLFSDNLSAASLFSIVLCEIIKRQRMPNLRESSNVQRKANFNQFVVSVPDSPVEQHMEQHDHVSNSLHPSVHQIYLTTVFLDIVMEYKHLSHCTPGPGIKEPSPSISNSQSQSLRSDSSQVFPASEWLGKNNGTMTMG